MMINDTERYPNAVSLFHSSGFLNTLPMFTIFFTNLSRSSLEARRSQSQRFQNNTCIFGSRFGSRLALPVVIFGRISFSQSRKVWELFKSIRNSKACHHPLFLHLLVLVYSIVVLLSPLSCLVVQIDNLCYFVELNVWWFSSSPERELSEGRNSHELHAEAELLLCKDIEQKMTRFLKDRERVNVLFLM